MWFGTSARSWCGPSSALEAGRGYAGDDDVPAQLHPLAATTGAQPGAATLATEELTA
jgi:hypothetical protein